MPIPNELEAFAEDTTQDPMLRDLAARGELRRYRKGTILIHEGDTGDTLFILLSGRIKIYSTDSHDKEITFGVFGAGEYVGEMALDGGTRSANVVTQLPSACSVITRSTLLSFIAQNPEFALTLLSKLIRRLRQATEDARSLAFVDVYGRLTRSMQEMAVAQPDGTSRISERITHQEIASRVGCSREMVSRILKDLQNGGYITVVDRRITLNGKLPKRW